MKDKSLREVLEKARTQFYSCGKIIYKENPSIEGCRCSEIIDQAIQDIKDLVPSEGHLLQCVYPNLDLSRPIGEVSIDLSTKTARGLLAKAIRKSLLEKLG